MFFLKFFYKIKSFYKWILNIALKIFQKKKLLALNRKSLILSTFNRLPSKRFLVLNKSWRRLQEMSLRRIQHVFSVTIFLSVKTFWKTKNFYAEDVYKKSWRLTKLSSVSVLLSFSFFFFLNWASNVP